jgi:hypothetical protein
MLRTKMDLLDYTKSGRGLMRQPAGRSEHTAYAIRSPFGSVDRIVGCPRFVVGDAAQIASITLLGLTTIDSRTDRTV